ncbi:spore coat U domain-containing protein [Cupriavidus necator]|nr:spore coat U domain-containing protein [Cupriavidus necator]
MRPTAVLRGVACALSAMLPLSLGAATKTTTFQVRLTLANDCAISVTDLDFGSQGVLAANIDQSSNLTVTCTSGAAYTVGLDAGSATGSTIATRLLIGPAAATVGYQLYRDSARAQVWGNTPATDTISGTGNGTAQTIPVYGRVPPQTTPAAGAYTSTVTATITF